MNKNSMRASEVNMQDIRTKAKGLGIKANKMNKTDLIHAIQRSEENIECYATDRVEHCEEFDCLWRSDCVKC
jgi:hypothetical protein